MRISDWSSDVCSSDLLAVQPSALNPAFELRDRGEVRRIGLRCGLGRYGILRADIATCLVEPARVLASVSTRHIVAFDPRRLLIGDHALPLVADRPALAERKSTRLKPSHSFASRLPSYA